MRVHLSRVLRLVPLLLVLLASVPAAQPARAQQGTDAPTTYLPLVAQGAAVAQVSSPDGRIAITVRLTNSIERRGALRFDVTYDGRVVIDGGSLGLNGEGCPTGAAPPAPLYEWLGSGAQYVHAAYTLAIGERSAIPDRYTELSVFVRRTNGDQGRRLNLLVRAYDEGVAVRYLFPQEEGFGPVTICGREGEKTLFRFREDATIWQQQKSEDPYQRTTLAQVAPKVETPLTMQSASGSVVSLAEAAVENYPRAVLRRAAGNPPALAVDFADAAQGAPVIGALPFRSPWRVMMFAPDFGTLLEQNYLLYNLADPLDRRLAGMTWAAPGTAMRAIDLSYVGIKKVIDFAAQHGIEYVELDTGWYLGGKDDDLNPSGSPEVPAIEFPPGEDMKTLVDYAAEQDPEVGLVLYINYVLLKPNIDRILPTYKEWGIKGLKFGFVRAYTQSEIKFVHDAVRDAALYGMFVNIHDDYRPSGLSRTYPNLFTQEGVRGNEYYPGADHNTTLPVTRFVLGAADYTIPYYSLKPEGAPGHTTRAHQLALSVVYFSPLKFVFWNDFPSQYQGEPEIEMFGRVPTVWDETRVLHAVPGESVAIARRSGREWYVGAITNASARTLDLPLDFLAPGVTYRATIYRDDQPTLVAVETQEVTRATTLSATMLATGGYTAWLEPIDQ